MPRPPKIRYIRIVRIESRIRKVLGEYAAAALVHANDVTQLVGSSARRMRVGDFRVVFENGETGIIVSRIGPRGGAEE